jgi:GTP-binding protein LepA
VSKVEIAINGDVCDPLSFVAHADKAANSGKKMALKLREVLSRQQFEIILQAKIGAKV